MANYKYDKIKDWLIEGIRNGEYKFGEKLPSEILLCNKFSISRQTARNAIDKLVEMGMAKRVQGSGTYVTKQMTDPKSKTVGVLLSYIDEYMFPKILLGVESVIAKNGYGIDLGMTHNDIMQERRFLKRMLDTNVSGLIVEGTKTGLPSVNLDLYGEIIQKQIPIVFVHNYYPQLKCPSVLMDDINLAKTLTNMLIQAGHKNIGGFFKFDDLQGQRRYYGYIQALKEAGLPIHSENIVWFSTETSEYVFDALKRPDNLMMDNCTAFICYNDSLAVKLAGYIESKGKSVPKDYSLVGFDDQSPLTQSNVQLTTAKHPKNELGVKAGKLLMKMINEGVNSVPKEHYEMQTSIVKRHSIYDISKTE